MQDDIHRFGQVYVIGNIVENETETLVAGQVGDVIAAAGDEVVHGDDAVAIREQAITEMRADETCAAGKKYAHCGYCAPSPAGAQRFYHSDRRATPCQVRAGSRWFVRRCASATMSMNANARSTNQ